jgi:hypothetical protein
MKHRYDYADFSAFLDACARPFTVENDWHASIEMGHSFTGTATYAEAGSLAINGVPDIESKMQAMVQDFTEAVGSTVQAFEYRYDVVGDDVDVSRYLSGEPECMFTTELTQREGTRILSIVLNGSAHSGISTEDIMRRGAATLVLIDLLERSGYRVEVTYVMAMRAVKPWNSPDRMLLSVVLKRAQDGLDLTRIAYALAHPSMLRRHMFRWSESLPLKLVRAFGCGGEDRKYGLPCKLEEGEMPADLTVDKDDISHFGSVESTKAWIREQVKLLTSNAQS